MSKTSEPATAVGVAVCDARAHLCRCTKPAGHVESGDPVHSCPPDRCTGQWVGDIDGDDFKPLAMPYAVSEPRPWEFE